MLGPDCCQVTQNQCEVPIDVGDLRIHDFNLPELGEQDLGPQQFSGQSLPRPRQECVAGVALRKLSQLFVHHLNVGAPRRCIKALTAADHSMHIYVLGATGGVSRRIHRVGELFLGRCIGLVELIQTLPLSHLPLCHSVG